MNEITRCIYEAEESAKVTSEKLHLLGTPREIHGLTMAFLNERLAMLDVLDKYHQRLLPHLKLVEVEDPGEMFEKDLSALRRGIETYIAGKRLMMEAK